MSTFILSLIYLFMIELRNKYNIVACNIKYINGKVLWSAIKFIDSICGWPFVAVNRLYEQMKLELFHLKVITDIFYYKELPPAAFSIYLAFKVR